MSSTRTYPQLVVATGQGPIPLRRDWHGFQEFAWTGQNGV